MPQDATGLAAARRLLHDQVVAICPKDKTVTLRLTLGYSSSRPVLFLTTEGAALEGTTHAPGLVDLILGPALAPLYVLVNGYTNGDLAKHSTLKNHPLRSGINSALRGDGFALDVLGAIPTLSTNDSPLFDPYLGFWTPEAVANGYRTIWLEELQVIGFVKRGLVTGLGGAAFGSSGGVSNFPIVYRFE